MSRDTLKCSTRGVARVLTECHPQSFGTCSSGHGPKQSGRGARRNHGPPRVHVPSVRSINHSASTPSTPSTQCTIPWFCREELVPSPCWRSNHDPTSSLQGGSTRQSLTIIFLALTPRTSFIGALKKNTVSVLTPRTSFLVARERTPSHPNRGWTRPSTTTAPRYGQQLASSRHQRPNVLDCVRFFQLGIGFVHLGVAPSTLVPFFALVWHVAIKAHPSPPVTRWFVVAGLQANWLPSLWPSASAPSSSSPPFSSARRLA